MFGDYVPVPNNTRFLDIQQLNIMFSFSTISSRGGKGKRRGEGEKEFEKAIALSPISLE